jgi:hypothetical protein
MVEIAQPPVTLPTGGIVQVTVADGSVRTLQRVSRDFKDAANFYVDYNGWNSGRSSMPARWHTQSTFTRTGALPVDPNEQGLEGRDPGRGRAAGPHRRAGVWGKRALSLPLPHPRT